MRFKCFEDAEAHGLPAVDVEKKGTFDEEAQGGGWPDLPRHRTSARLVWEWCVRAVCEPAHHLAGPSWALPAAVPLLGMRTAEFDIRKAYGFRWGVVPPPPPGPGGVDYPPTC